MSYGCYYGPLETWKVVYHPADSSKITLGTAFVEADSEQSAYQAFREQYAGEYFTIKSVKKLLG